MTTRKQMYARLEVQRARDLEESRRSGLEAQQRDREHREDRLREAQRDKHDKQHSWKKIDKECILCKDLLKDQHVYDKELELNNAR